VLSSAVSLPATVENVPLQADHRSAIGSITDRLPGGITVRLPSGILIGFAAESRSASTGFLKRENGDTLDRAKWASKSPNTICFVQRNYLFG